MSIRLFNEPKRKRKERKKERKGKKGKNRMEGGFFPLPTKQWGKVSWMISEVVSENCSSGSPEIKAGRSELSLSDEETNISG